MVDHKNVREGGREGGEVREGEGRRGWREEGKGGGRGGGRGKGRKWERVRWQRGQ